MLNKKDIMNKMERYLEENLEEARDIVSQINGYNESLEELYVYSMYEFDDVMECANIKGIELINKVEYGDFNTGDSYFIFDGLGNLKSYTEWEYNQLVFDYIPEIVERYIDLAGHVYADDEMEALMCEYEECE